jgi:hypothetical protein
MAQIFRALTRSSQSQNADLTKLGAKTFHGLKVLCAVYCLLFAVCCLLSAVCCLLSVCAGFL